MPCMGDSMDIFVASDHNGTAARNHIMRVLKDLEQKGYFGVDLGPSEYEGKVDYPDMAQKLALRMKPMPGFGMSLDWGILVCGTGSGMEMAANRFPWIRAAIATDKVTAQLMRQHND